MVRGRIRSYHGVMAVYIDDEAVTLKGTELGAVIEDARTLMEGRGRVIVEVNLNGRPLLGQELDQSRTMAVDGAEIRLVSAQPRDLAVETLSQVHAQLNEARRAQHQAADLLQRDHPKEAMKEIGKAVAVWQQTQQAVRFSTALLGISLEGRLFEGKPISEAMDLLVARLISLRDMMTAGDSLGLADSLQYEWSEVVEQWQRLVDQILLWVDEA